MTIARANHPAEILLVDDDENYHYFAQQAFKRTGLKANLHYVDDGRKCLDFLRRRIPYSDAPAPDIVLLDIEMPVMDGREVLAEIIRDESLKHVAVVVFTTRDERAEILSMYRMRCNSYICKPPDFDDYVEVIRKLADYWLSVVMLPSRIL